MNDVKKASFAFKNYQIKKFSLNEPVGAAKDDELIIVFDPSGVLTTESGGYQLTLGFRASIKLVTPETEETNDHDIVNAELAAYFQFTDVKSTEDIPSYFYRNSIAIVFPYLRAFVTTLTMQAGVKPIILPIMNLMSLEGQLKENTIVV